MTFPNMPSVDFNEQETGKPLLHWTGAELADSVVIHASVVTADSASRRIVPAGGLLLKITSGHALNKYGPYLKTASDGRQTLTKNASVVTTAARETTLGDKSVAGYYGQSSFDLSQLTTYGVSKHGASLTALEAVFPTCSFRD